MIHLRALLLDFDGLLADTEPVHYRGFAEVAAAHGITLAEDVYYRDYVGYDDRDGFRAIWRDAGRTLTDAELVPLLRAKAEVVAAALTTHVVAAPGAVEFVRAAADIYQLGVCSGALRSEVELGLEGLGLRPLIPLIVAAEDVPHAKPDPAGYKLLIERMSLAAVAAGDPPLAPHLCCALEDTHHGLIAARRAGAWAVATTVTEPAAQLEAYAHLVVPTLAALDPADIAARIAARL